MLSVPNNTQSWSRDGTANMIKILSSQHSGLHICHINAQSLYRKMDEFRHIFEGSPVDIVRISETWFDDSITDMMVSVMGYEIFRVDRKGFAGGVAIYMKKGLNCKPRFTSDGIESIEYIFLDICSLDRTVLIGSVYRPNNLDSLINYAISVRNLCSTLEASGLESHKNIPMLLQELVGTSVKIFAFLDDGSNATLLQRDICDQLGLEGEAKNLCLKWTSETSRVEEDSLQVDVFISGCKEMSKKYELSNVRTVKNLSLPMQNVLKQDLESYPYLRNIPITTYSNASPKILIGLNNSYVCNSLKTIEGNRNEPSVTKTRLGWVIHGGNEVSMEKTVGFHNKEYCHCDDEIEKLQRVVSEYMSLENVGCKYELVSEEEKRAIQILEKNTHLVGRKFETDLLWKENIPVVPDSFSMAMKRLQCLEKKASLEHIQIITQQIDDLVKKGYARKVGKTEVLEGVTWYLPIFTVTNPNKPGKIRLVWDAAAKVNNTSLNSMLLKGPDLVTPLLTVLHGFRIGKIAISGDIKEMFHQVLIRKEDQGAQRFLWRNAENRNPDI
ncbi:uncharacterized protein LOC142231450 [Haematobia irritans]|uniref:uncharacterized protein LOC142231450 n=1 Tax=Haematobia irritans TaxID=7368 RepID=UPI003F4F6386